MTLFFAAADGKQGPDSMREKENIRLMVLETLLERERTGKKLDGIMNAVLENIRYLPKTQRAFYARLTEGTIEEQIRLDHILGCYSRTPVSKMKPVIRSILRLSAYQILEMDAVPDSAAVNEAVKLAKIKGFGSLAGFVNGVLRSMLRDPQRGVLPEKTDMLRYLSIRYSMPEFLVRQWVDRFGAEAAEKMCASFLEPKKTTIRIRPGRTQECLASLEKDGADTVPAPYLPCAWRISGYETLTELSAFSEGLFFAQDVSSMLAVAAAGIREDEKLRILDVCAAPGGKCLMAADLASEASEILAGDISETKTALIEENARRLGIRNLKTRVWDAAVPDPALFESMDLVFADVPCSGYGVIGHKPDIKYHASTENQAALAALQLRILKTASMYVRPGGVLIYSTCTVSEEENEKNAARFLENGGFAPEDMTPYLPSDLSHTTADQWMLQLLPGRDNCDGFFIARLRRKK